MKELQTVLNNILTDKNTNLKPENLKKGVTCLGVTGTYEGSGGGSTVEGVKQFSTVEEMNSSTGNTEGDLAIVYRNTLANMTADTETQYITFPDTVTLPTAFTGEYYDMVRAVDDSGMFDGQVMLNQTSFEFSGYSETGETTINYTSTDGITYTRSTTITNPVDLGTVVKSYYEWNDNLGYFMQVSSSSFTGLYKYNSTAWELAPTDLTTVADDVYLTKFYGANGIEQGTLQNIENLSKDNINKRVKLWDIFNSGMVCPSDVSAMFKDCTNLQTIPLLDTSSVTSMDSMFMNCTNLQTIPLLNTGKVTNMQSMFSDCINLTEIPQLDTSKVTNMNSMFSSCTNLTTIPQLDTSNVTNMDGIFSSCTNLTTIPQLDTSSVKSMFLMFKDCTNLQTIPLLDTSSVTSMFHMFNGCTSLTEIPLLNTGKVTNMQYTFSGCTSLTEIPLLNTGKVTKMQSMFIGCTSLSDESLNNILAMCANATSYTSTKTLKYIGLTSDQATKCTTLSNYSAFTAAGWTTDY